MTKQEKIDVILEAAKTYPKSRIDEGGKGKAVKKLQDGQNVTDAKLDEMVERVQALSQGTKPQEPSQKAEKEAVKTLSDAGLSQREIAKEMGVSLGQVNGVFKNIQMNKNEQLEPEAATEEHEEAPPLLKDGQNVTDIKLDEMVACIQTLQGVAPIQEGNSESNQTIEQSENNVEQNEGEDSQIMMQRITQLEEALARKDEQIKAFEERLSKVEGYREQSAQSTEQREDSRILGFRLLKKKTYTKWQDQQLCYEKWYAVKGKKVVYLGADPQDAENKIKSYCQRRGFSLESKVMA